MSDYHAHFDPLRPPTKTGRLVSLLVGPLLWLAALVVVAVAANRTDLLRYGLFVAGGSFLLGIVVLLPARAHRLREERKPAPRR